MTPDEIEIIRQAQDYCRRRKGDKLKIHCPFTEVFQLITICEICYNWMELTYKGPLSWHPCNELDIEEVRSRFWRNPKLVGKANPT